MSAVPARAALAVAAVVAALVAAAPLSALAQQGQGGQERPPREETGAPDTGREIYQQDCAVCHGSTGEGTFRGPPIDEVGTASIDFMVRTGRMPIPEPTNNPSGADPAYGEDAIRALVEYTARFVSGPEAVESLDVEAADLARGGEIYRLECAACHQTAGGGGALAYGTTAPELTDSTAVETFEAMRVGPGDMPVFGPEAIDDDDAVAVAAYVEYLHSPEDPGGLHLWHLGPVPEGFVAWVFGLGATLLIARWLGIRQKPSTE